MIGYVEVPRDILDLNNDVTIADDVMFVNRMPFLVSASTYFIFTTAEYFPLPNQADLKRSIIIIFKHYEDQGFILKVACMDC